MAPHAHSEEENGHRGSPSMVFCFPRVHMLPASSEYRCINLYIPWWKDQSPDQRARWIGSSVRNRQLDVLSGHGIANCCWIQVKRVSEAEETIARSR